MEKEDFSKKYKELSNLYCTYYERKHFVDYVNERRNEKDLHCWVKYNISKRCFLLENDMVLILSKSIKESLEKLEYEMVLALRDIAKMGRLDTTLSWYKDEWNDDYFDELCKKYKIS